MKKFWLLCSLLSLNASANSRNYLSCAGELMEQSRGKLFAFNQTAHGFCLATKSGVDFFTENETVFYLFPKPSLVTENGGTIYYLRLAVPREGKFVFATFIDIGGKIFITENSQPNSEEAELYATPNPSPADGALDRLREEIAARISDVPGYLRRWNQRWPKSPHLAHWGKCEAIAEDPIRTALIQAKRRLSAPISKTQRDLSSVPLGN